jgi:hypothetical protein
VNALGKVTVPPEVVTATLCAPVIPAGVTAVIEVALTTTTLVAATPPTVTLLAPVKFVPVIVIGVPPANTPVLGLTELIVGTAIYVNALGKLTVPPAVVTAMLCTPAVPGGVTAVIEVALTTTTLVAATPPTVTLLAPVKFVPVIVKAVLPKVEPDVGEILAMVGAGTTYVNALGKVAVPPAVITATLCAPAVPGGVTAVIEVALTTTTLVAATPPTVTLLAPVKFVPVIVKGVLPKVEPTVGEILVMVGSGTTYVNALGKVAVPPAVITATLCAPAVPGGVNAVIEVALTTTTLVAATPPTVTLLAPVKFVPVIVKGVLPKVEPTVGEMLVIVGAGTTYVNALGKLTVPPAVVTATLCAPAVPGGVTAVIEVALTTTTLVAATPPTVTLLAPVKFVPVIVKGVLPKVEPTVGEMLEMVGAETT